MEEDLPPLWVIDALQTGESYPPFHFYLYDPNTEVVLSYHIESDEAPQDGLVVGIIHPDGVEAGKKYLEVHENEFKKLLGDRLFV